MSGLPRVVIDGRMVGPVPHGFGRYVSSLALGLLQISADGPLAYEPIFLIRAGTAPREFSGFQTCEVGAKFLSPLEMVEIPILLRRLKAAVYHSPTFSSLPSCPCPSIVTVHDLNHLQFGGFKEKLYYERLLKPFIKKSKAVATVSEFSRQEIGRWSGMDPRYIDVVYNAMGPAFQERVDPSEIDQVVKKFGLKKKQYFFCLSNTKPHKNLNTLISAYAQYRTQGPETSHLGTGPADPWELVLNLPGPSAVAGLRLIGPPTDEEIRALMAGAGTVVFPSRYEGFGLPPVEAACLGAPLIVSRIPPHREGLADLIQGEVLWVEPEDVAAWAKALGRAAAGAVLGASMESRSLLLRRFSTLNLGAHMDRIYKRVLQIGL